MEAWRELMDQFGNVTVREAAMTTGTSTVALATLVSTRAAFQMLTKVDARNFCRLDPVPPGGGTTFYVQYIPAVKSTSGTGSPATGVQAEGTAATETVYAPKRIAYSLSIFIIWSTITDLLQRQSAINFADAMGKLHGNAMIREVNYRTYYNVVNVGHGSRSVTVDIGGVSDNSEAELAWADIMLVKQRIESLRGDPDVLVSSPKKIYEVMRKDAAANIYMGAMADFLKTGKIPVLAGLSVFMDYVFADACGATSESYGYTQYQPYAIALQSDEAVGFAQAWDISAEIQRYAENAAFKLVTTLAGDSQPVVQDWIGYIEHA
jgi:hypothetical protein